MTNRDLPSPDLEAQMRALERITHLFRAERMVYLAFAIASFTMLLVLLVVALIRQQQSIASTIGEFGASGVVAFTSGRVLVMWNKALSVITSQNGGGHV